MHPSIARAYEILDRLNDPERIERERRERAELDRQYATGERREWQGLVHKREASGLPSHEQAKVKAWMAHQQQQINDLDPAVQARWDDWFDRRFKQRLIDQFEGEALLNQIFAETFSIVRDGMRAELTKLRDEFNREIGSLRADFTLQKAIAKGEIAQLVTKQDEKSDAA